MIDLRTRIFIVLLAIAVTVIVIMSNVIGRLRNDRDDLLRRVQSDTAIVDSLRVTADQNAQLSADLMRTADSVAALRQLLLMNHDQRTYIVRYLDTTRTVSADDLWTELLTPHDSLR